MSTAPEPAPRPRKPRAAANPLARGASWAAGLAALVLVLVSLGGYFYHRRQLSGIAAGHLRLMVTGPAQLHSGARAEYCIRTTDLSGGPLPARIEFALSSPDGQLIRHHNESTDESGCLRIALAGNTALPARAELRVVASHDRNVEEVQTTLAVVPPRYATQLSLDKPLYRPGETVRYRSLSLTRFGLAADGPLPVRFEVLGPEGMAVAGSRSDGLTDRGVGGGEFRVSDSLPDGRYTLLAHSLDGAFPDARRSFTIAAGRERLRGELRLDHEYYAPGDTVTADVRAERPEGGGAARIPLRVTATVDGRTIFFQAGARTDASGRLRLQFSLPAKIERGAGQLAVSLDNGEPQETLVRDIPIRLGKVLVSFRPEGGSFVEGLENRVYFTACDPLGRPVAVQGTVVDGRGKEVAKAETNGDGRGRFSLKPRAGESYRLKLAGPKGVAEQPALPAATEAAADPPGVVLDTGPGVFDAGAPLRCSIRTLRPGLPLVVAASCRGVPVGQAELTTEAKDKEDPVHAVSVPVDEQACGVIRLTVYDYRASPPRPLAERLVYRRPARRLEIRAVPPRSYRSGEQNTFSFTVTNEKGQPLPATLGVLVVGDGAPTAAENALADLPAQFLFAGEITQSPDLERAGLSLSSEKKEAAEALDLLLGTQPVGLPAEKSGAKPKTAAPGGRAAQPDQPPMMFDNLKQLQGKYEKDLADYRGQQDRRTQVVGTLVTASFFGGLGLLLLVTMLGLMKVVSGFRLWMPAIGSIVCCLILGAVLMDPSRLGSGDAAVTGFSPYQAPPADPPPEAKDETEKHDGDRPKIPEKPFVFHEYAHPSMSAATGGGRKATETLYWHPCLSTGPDGRAEVRFVVPPQPGRFRVLVEAHGEGRIGSLALEFTL